jgi:hypothetical protein
VLVRLALDAQLMMGPPLLRAPFDGLPLPAILALLAFCGVAGLAMGHLFFRALWVGVQRLVDGGRPLGTALLAVGRVTLLVLGLLAVSLAGALPLLVAVGGLMAGRRQVLRSAGETGS